jgi:hypothetical protein
MDTIACFYINLAEETEKNMNTIKELNIFNGVVRVDAHKHSNGAYGLAISDMLTLDLAEKQSQEVICIFEDDFQWEISKDNAVRQLETILKLDFDLVLLSYHIPVVTLYDLNPPLARVTNGQTTCGFMFKKSFIPKLREAFQVSRDNLLTGPADKYAVDQTWKVLQTSEYNTFASIPRMGKQRTGMSNIENKMVSYGGGCFMIVLSCKKHDNRRAEQDLSKCPFPYKYFIGSDTERVDNNIVYLECGDNYEDLPMKTYKALEWVRINYPYLDYVFKTDDDIKIDMVGLYNLYTQLMLHKISYAGRAIVCNEHISTYHYGKCSDKSKEIPISMKKSIYCSGGGYFLNRKSVDLCLTHKETYQHHIFEDHATGNILNANGIMPIHVNNLHNNICHW